MGKAIFLGALIVIFYQTKSAVLPLAMLIGGIAWTAYCLLNQRTHVKAEIESLKLKHAESIAKGNFDDASFFQAEIEWQLKLLKKLNGWDDLRRVEEKLRAQDERK